MPPRTRIARVLPYALPVMAGYLAIGIPCGILEAEVGLAPWMAFLLSATFYTGAGQFMLSNLWLAGQAPLAIAASISFVNLRQLLYSAAFAPRFQKAKGGISALFALTVTDESFGVNQDRFAQADEPGGAPWDERDATALNYLCMASWALANFVGALAGDALAIPTAVASFAMTSIFICLLFARSFTSATAIVAAVSASAVVVSKLIGWDQPAIMIGAVAGVAAGALSRRSANRVPEAAALDAEEEGAYSSAILDPEALDEAEDEAASKAEGAVRAHRGEGRP